MMKIRPMAARPATEWKGQCDRCGMEMEQGEIKKLEVNSLFNALQCILCKIEMSNAES